MHSGEFVYSCLLLLGIFFFQLLGSCRVGFRNLSSLEIAVNLKLKNI